MKRNFNGKFLCYFRFTSMKNILYLFIILSFSNCNNRIEPILKPEKIVAPKNKTEAINLKTDTLTTKSEPFKINGINCYWEFALTIDKGEKVGSSLLELKESISKKILLSHPDLGRYDATTKNNLDFKENFKDANFDGLQDFVVSSQENSGSGGTFYNVYLFNKALKTFVLSKELSGGELDINNTNRTVSTSWKMGCCYNLSQVHHFNKSGKINFTAITTTEEINTATENLLKITYKKVVNGKIIETRVDIDTTKFEGH